MRTTSQPPELDLPRSTVRALLTCSYIIRVLGLVWLFYTAALVSLIVRSGADGFIAHASGDTYAMLLFLIVCPLVVLLALACYGSFMRSKKGWIASLFVCALMLCGSPLNIALGSLGLVTLIKGSQLYGIDRISHESLRKALSTPHQNS